jgi:hypothetical protein
MLNLSLFNTDDVPILRPTLPGIGDDVHYIKVGMERLQVA